MLYNTAFIDSIPDPQGREERPLVNLKSNHPDLLQRFNHWYQELLPDGDPELAGNLRNIKDPENFLAGLWELTIFRYLKQQNHDVLYNHLIGGKKPDLYWPKVDLIADIISISDPQYRSREYIFINELTDAINKLDLPFDLSFYSIKFNGESYKKSKILDWILSFSKKPLPDLLEERHIYNDGESTFDISIMDKTVGHNVKFNAAYIFHSEETKEIIKSRISKKLNKYKRPIIVFACSGFGPFSLDTTTLHMALYGDTTLTINRKHLDQPGQWGQKANGLFYNRMKNGLPANERIVAVVYAARSVENGKFSLRFKVYHNPFSTSPLSQDFFQGNAQLIVTEENDEELRLNDINEDNLLVEVK